MQADGTPELLCDFSMERVSIPVKYLMEVTYIIVYSREKRLVKNAHSPLHQDFLEGPASSVNPELFVTLDSKRQRAKTTTAMSEYWSEIDDIV